MKFLASLLLLLAIFSSPSYCEDNPWQLNQNKLGIPVYTRKIAGSPILEYKASITINAPIEAALKLFEDEAQIPRWYFQCVHSQLLKNEDPDHKVIYLVLHFPWPVAARDFIFRRSRSDDPKTGIVSYSLTALPDKLPQVKGIIRVQSIKSIWIFTPLPHNQTEVFFQQHTDPGGSIPPAIINKICIETPYYSLMNFRRLLTGSNSENSSAKN